MGILEKAFELSVVISAIDRFTGPMKKAQHSMTQTQKDIDNVTKSMKVMGSSDKEIKKVTDSLKKFEESKALAKFTKELKDAGVAEAEINKISSGFDKLTRQQEKLDKLSASYAKFKKVALVGAATTIAGGAMAKESFKWAESAGDIQTMNIQLGGIEGLSQTSKELADINKQAEKLSTLSLFSKKDILRENIALAQAQVSLQNLSKVIPSATYLAEMEVGLGKSSGVDQTAYNFARMAEDARITNDEGKMKDFADSVYRAISVTHMNSESMGETFKYAMPVVKNLGWNEKDMVLASEVGAVNGMEGSMAGTHIKDFAERLNPYKYLGTKGGQKQLEAMSDMGIIGGLTTHKGKGGKEEITGFKTADLMKDRDSIKSYADMVQVLTEKHDAFIKTAGNSKKYTSMMTEEDTKKLQERTKELTGSEFSGGELEWAALNNHLFGEQGQDFAIISSHKAMVDKVQGANDRQNPLEDQAVLVRNSFKGEMHQFTSNLQTLKSTLGTSIMDAMSPILHKINFGLQKMLDFFEAHPKITKFFAVAVAAGLTLVGTLITVAGAIGMVAVSLRMLGVKKEFKLLSHLNPFKKPPVAATAEHVGEGIASEVKGLKNVSKIAKFGKALGIVGTVASVGLAAFDIYDQSKKVGVKKAISSGGGQLVGGAVGGTIGGIIGSAILPGIGTVVGAAIGSMVGDTLGSMADKGGWTKKVVDTSIASWNFLKSTSISAFNTIKTFAITKFAEAKKGVKDFIEGAKNWFKEFPTHVGYAIGYAIGWLKKLPERAYKFFGEMYDKISSWVSKTYEGIKQWLSDLPEKISKWWNGMPGTISKLWNEAYTSVTKWASDLYTSSTGWASKTYKDIIDWFKKIPDEIGGFFDGAMKWIDKVLGKAKDIGSEVSNGFSQGYEASGAAAPVLGPPIPKHAYGGIFNSPHIGMIGEAGAEAVIPLSNKSRGMDLWIQTGKMLGAFNSKSNPSSSENLSPRNSGNSIGEVHVHIYPQPGQNVEEIADMVVQKIGRISQKMNMNMGTSLNLGAF